MSERASIEAQERAINGKKAKQWRSEGWIPGVIYGQGENVHILVENIPLRRVLRHAGLTNLIEVNIGDSQRTVLAKDVQSHPTRRDLIHVDFYEVNMQETLVVDASLVSTGVAAPTLAGLGSTTLVLYSVQIECLPDKLISEIEVDMTLIETPDDYVHVRDLAVPEGVTILTDADAVVAQFVYEQLVEEEEEEEELLFAPSADEVEVIGRGKAEEEEEEETD